MSLGYKLISWNPAKRRYDLILAAGATLYLALFLTLGATMHPNATAETLVIRAFGTLAILLLHLILAIGPLCRLHPSLLPLLYNRRHLGVTMFLTALVHGVFSIVQFHAFGDVNPIVSLFTSSIHAPFQQLGAIALVILFFMAATSHDFWLHTFGPEMWKRLHMLVYLAYALLIAHVSLGALQSQTSPILVALVALGLITLASLHLTASLRERTRDIPAPSAEFVEVCRVEDIPDNRARTVCVSGERVAVFKYDGKVSAIGNVCRHQGGPLGEGRIIDGCVTCPWHGYQYLPGSGASPPPFQEKVPSFRTKVVNGMVLLDPRPLAPGTPVEPARVS